MSAATRLLNTRNKRPLPPVVRLPTKLCAPRPFKRLRGGRQRLRNVVPRKQSAVPRLQLLVSDTQRRCVRDERRQRSSWRTRLHVGTLCWHDWRPTRLSRRPTGRKWLRAIALARRKQLVGTRHTCGSSRHRPLNTRSKRPLPPVARLLPRQRPQLPRHGRTVRLRRRSDTPRLWRTGSGARRPGLTSDRSALVLVVLQLLRRLRRVRRRVLARVLAMAPVLVLVLVLVLAATRRRQLVLL